MGFRLDIDSFYGLRKVRWAPSGVCAITGPNGAGKTTLLHAPAFLVETLHRGIGSAVEKWAGPARLRTEGTPPEQETVLRLGLGDLSWEIRPVAAGAGMETPLAEEVRQAGTVLLSQARGQSDFVYRGRTLKSLHGTPGSAFGRVLDLYPDDVQSHADAIEMLREYRLYVDPAIRALRMVGSQVTADTHLYPDGSNAFAVLRNWKAGERAHQERWELVITGLSEAFPGFYDGLDFQAAGQMVTVRFYLRGSRNPAPALEVANGLLSALVQLCAVASAPEHGAVAIDEPENGLHPFAIRKLVELFRARALEKDLTVLLATHSPVLLDQFNQAPSQVYVMEPGREENPIPLNEHSDPQWLAHFALGDLYRNGRFGAQSLPQSWWPRSIHACQAAAERI